MTHRKKKPGYSYFNSHLDIKYVESSCTQKIIIVYHNRLTVKKYLAKFCEISSYVHEDAFCSTEEKPETLSLLTLDNALRLRSFSKEYLDKVVLIAKLTCDQRLPLCN